MRQQDAVTCLPLLPGGSTGALSTTPSPKAKNCSWLLDPNWVWEACSRRWRQIVWVAVVLAMIGSIAGFRTVTYNATVRLMRNDSWNQLTSTPGQAAPAVPLTPAVVSLLKSPDLLQRVAAASGLSLNVEDIAACSEIVAGPDAGGLQVRIHAHHPAHARQLAETYGEEASRYLQQFQANEVRRLEKSCEEKLQAIDQALAASTLALKESLRDSGFVNLEKGPAAYLQQHEDLTRKLDEIRVQKETLDLQISNFYKIIAQHHPALLAARQALDQALLRYTDEHPKVQELRTNMALIELRIAAQSAQGDPEVALNGSSLAQGLYAKVIELRTQRMSLEKQAEEMNRLKSGLEEKIGALSDKQLAHQKARAEYESLQQKRLLLTRWQSENQLLATSGSAPYQVVQPAELLDSSPLRRWQASALWGGGGAILGLLASSLLLALVEVSDRRIRSARELARVTQLPVLASLGDLGKMNESQKKNWAFQTLTTLQGRLAASTRQALVCGFVSSQPGEGRSTWVQLLAEAASARGYRVVTMLCNQSGAAASSTPPDAPAGGRVMLPLDITRTALSTEVSPIVEIPITAWAWNLDRRAQWQEALNQLKSMENLIVFMELPAASVNEAILLSENLSNLIWLCAKNMANAPETCAHLEALANARATVIGTVFNHGPSPRRRRSLFNLFAALGLVCTAWSASLAAQESVPAPAVTIRPDTNAVPVLSGSSQTALAEWQKRLTLGPGDILQVGLYGQPDSMRPSLVIGPDGRLNYLQARDVMAAGFTVDELRDELEKVLLKFYRPPLRVIVIPQAYRSKKYFLLGNVAQTGVFPLDRPVTIVEAIATAGGFVSTVQRRNNLMLADLSRSFLIRRESNGQYKRVGINFESLFLKGDLHENALLAPDDYLYFPPMDLPEVYVLGEVAAPGATPFGPGMGVMKAIAAQGGFTLRAWRQKILIVRGSLNRPVTFSLNGADVMAARSLDFKLEPRDIIYVARKPWARAEELLEAAVIDFTRAAVITYAGAHVGPFITEPIFK